MSWKKKIADGVKEEGKSIIADTISNIIQGIIIKILFIIIIFVGGYFFIPNMWNYITNKTIEKVVETKDKTIDFVKEKNEKTVNYIGDVKNVVNEKKENLINNIKTDISEKKEEIKNVIENKKEELINSKNIKNEEIKDIDNSNSNIEKKKETLIEEIKPDSVEKNVKDEVLITKEENTDNNSLNKVNDIKNDVKDKLNVTKEKLGDFFKKKEVEKENKE